MAEQFTLPQITRYCELIQLQKVRELRLKTMLHTQAVGYATGSVKRESFFKFLDELEVRKSGKEINVSKTLQKLKKFDISFEER